MGGASAGVNASYGSESGTTNSTTKSNGTSGTDFQTMLAELTNGSSRTSTALPAYAQAGMKQSYTGDLAASGLAKDFLSSLISGDLYGGTGSKFAPAISNMFESQLAKARTGDTSMAGTARQGYREGEALAGAERDLLGIGMNASNSLLQYANPNQSLALIGSLAPKDTVYSQNKNSDTRGSSKTNQQSKSNTVGSSDSSSWGVGGSLGCCFIFLEIYNGTLPWYVRRCRDEFTTGPRRRGYNALASHLVPLMQQNKWVRRLVNWTMVKPMTAFGGWLYSEPEHKFGWLAAPITALWFSVFGNIGKNLPE